MASPAVLRIDVVADATKAIKALQETGTAAETAGGGWKSAGKAIGGVVSAAAIVGFGTASVKAAEESAVANARLEQVFSSMGDTTGNAAKAAEDYAAALSKKIAVDDEVILAGQAQLATFGEVSSEVARQAGIFDRATAAGADLAAAGFGSIESNAVQLGKALQDPEKGMTALAKSGVTFTDAQKEQIKALQESGDLLGAQNIVLSAVESQVKGTAEATATSTGKASLAFGELQEQVGGKLAPAINTVMDLFTRYSSVLIPIAGIIAGIMVVTKAWQIAQSAMAVVTGIVTAAQWAWNIAVTANPIGLIVIAIAAVIAAIVLLFTKVDWFRDALQAAFQGVVAAFNWVVDAAKAVFRWIADNWPLLLAILTGPIGIAVLLITKHWDTISDAAKAMVQWVSDRFQDLVGFISRVAETIGGIMSGIATAIKWPIDAATEMVKWVTDKVQALADFLSNIVSGISTAVGSVVDAIKGPINGVIRAWNGLEFTVPKIEVGPVTFGGQTIGFPNIPELARGGRVLSTGLAVVHEGETFSGVGRSLAGGTVINITVQHTGLGVDSPQLQRDLVNTLRGYVARNGPVDVLRGA